jgi:hypothetical protein
MVLGLINKKTTVWIVPKSDEELERSSCALTGPLKYDIQKDGSFARGAGSGDTSILLHPKLGDDTLRHELVHAYLYSYNKFHPLSVDYRTEYASYTVRSEEVLAHQIENIYMSQAKRPLTLDYISQAPAEKKEIYDFLADNYFPAADPEVFLATRIPGDDGGTYLYDHGLQSVSRLRGARSGISEGRYFAHGARIGHAVRALRRFYEPQSSIEDACTTAVLHARPGLVTGHRSTLQTAKAKR